MSSVCQVKVFSNQQKLLVFGLHLTYMSCFYKDKHQTQKKSTIAIAFLNTFIRLTSELSPSKHQRENKLPYR